MKNLSLFNNPGQNSQSVFDSKNSGAKHTSKEIEQQPQLWIDTYNVVVRQEATIKHFMDKMKGRQNLQVILSGAGTSAYIGNILEGPFQKNTGISTRAIATTDLVSHPELYFQKERPTLLVSFARSGNSPESLAAINLGNILCHEIYHLKITCNKDGEMVRNVSKETSLVFLLPQEAHDQSLAMTSSFTSMLLAGLLISTIDSLEESRSQIEVLAEYGKNILKNYTHILEKVANLDFKRAVFLGSGPLLGSARESHLKLQELTDGKVICKHDSFLGFRHGPKVVIDSSTLMVYLFSNNPYVHQYESDLVKDINNGERGMFSIGIIESETELQGSLDISLHIILSTGKDKLKEELLSICHVLVAQILGFCKSLNLGLKPDAPSTTNAITRVVQGVHIYPFFTSYDKSEEPV